jgi:hypothetical protein
VSLLKQDVDGERGVSRHILRKVNDNEALILDVRADVGELRKELGELRKEVSAMHSALITLQADLPGMIASVAEILREDLAKRK